MRKIFQILCVSQKVRTLKIIFVPCSYRIYVVFISSDSMTFFLNTRLDILRIFLLAHWGLDIQIDFTMYVAQLCADLFIWISH